MSNLSFRALTSRAHYAIAAIALAFSFAASPCAAQALNVFPIGSGYDQPAALTVDALKTVIVTDDGSGPPLTGLPFVNGAYAASPTRLATANGAFVAPTGVAVDQGGNIFVVDNEFAGGVVKEVLAPNYVTVNTLATPGLVSELVSVAIDSKGNLFWLDNEQGQVIEASPPSYGTTQPFYVAASVVRENMLALAIDHNDNIFILEQIDGTSQILEFTAASNYATKITIAAGNIVLPGGGAFDSRNNLYVTDAAGNTLTEFVAPDYAQFTVLDSTHFDLPRGVALDANDNIFVASSDSHQVFEIPAQPAVTGLSPASGPIGGNNTVTITGVHLTGATAVTFGGAPAFGFIVNSDTQVTAIAPHGSLTVDVIVTTPNGTSIPVPADLYSYTAAPVVTSLRPTSGPVAGGTLVTINGMNFAQASAVSFGGTPATNFSVLGQTVISAIAPAGAAGTVDVTVTTPGGTSALAAGDSYTYVAAPTVSGLSPNSGPAAGGTSVTISGSGFTGATAVSFGSSSATPFNVTNDTTITATSPGGSGTVDVTVTTVDGTSATSAADGFTYIPVTLPTVGGLAPSSGPTAGGTIVTITGTNFSGVSAVKFGGSAAVWFNVMSATSITAKAPAGSGMVNVTVTNTFGTSATSAADQFTYVAPTSRTFVSAATGNDTNVCSRDAPCLTFAAALRNTQAAGEIDVLDPGDFGPVTITESITIDGGGGVAGGAGAMLGASGITISAGATDVVSLRGLVLNGYGETGASGVVFNSGARLQIEGCTFLGFGTAGIAFTPGSGSATTTEMFVVDSTINGSATGVLIKPSAGIGAAVSLLRDRIDQNAGDGLVANGTGGSGPIRVTVGDSSASQNTGNGVAALSGQTSVNVDIIHTAIAGNASSGIQSQGSATKVTVGNSAISENGAAIEMVNGGMVLSYATNQMSANHSNGNLPGSASLQ